MGIEYKGEGGKEKVPANIEFLDETRDIAGVVAGRLWWWVENLISKITKLWRARKNMTGRVKKFGETLRFRVASAKRQNQYPYPSFHFFLPSTPLPFS